MFNCQECGKEFEGRKGFAHHRATHGRWQDEELILRPIAGEVVEAYRSVLGQDRQLLLAVAIIRENAPHLLSPHLLQQLMEAEGYGETHRRLVDADQALWRDIQAQLAIQDRSSSNGL